MTDLLVLAAIALMVGAALLTIRRARKKGAVCIGCPSGSCSGCTGCGHGPEQPEP